MACFTDIPNEVLCYVFADLGQTDLAHLSLVSRRLRSVAEPFLYRQVSLSTIRVPVFESFEHTISSRPELLTNLKSLTLRWGKDSPMYWYHPHKPDTPPTIDAWLFKVVMSMFGVKFVQRRKWHHFLPLLHLLPRLEVLTLWPTGDLDIFQIPPGHVGLPRFECLREVRCNWENRMRTVCATTLIFLLKLPSLRTLELRLPRLMQAPHWTSFPKNSIGSSGVTDLQLSYGLIDSSELQSVLRVPRALTHLSYTSFPRTHFNIRNLGWLVEQIGRPTLQFLALTFAPLDPAWIEYHGFNIPIPSLRDWPVLWSIRSSLTVLLGPGPTSTAVHLIDVLPVVIRELEIELDAHWTATEFAAEVVEMLKLKEEGHFDQLTVLKIPMEVYESVPGVGVACDDAGVEMVLYKEL